MNLDLTEKIVLLFSEHPVSEITVETEGFRVHAVRPLGASPPPAPAAALPAQDGLLSDAEAPPPALPLPSPMVGVFYHLTPPLPLGTEIVPGQKVGAIESMKLMTDVAAEAGGRVSEILIDDGAPVEYGQTLFRLTAL